MFSLSNLANLFKNLGPKTVPAPVIKPEEISCIVKSILDDLKEESNWKKTSVFDNGYYIGFKFSCSKYALIVYALNWNSSYAPNNVIRLEDFSYTLNSTECKIIGDRIQQICQNKINQQKALGKQKEMEKLKEIFPNCFK